MCINSKPSRRPSVKVVNQNGSVQLGEKAAENFLGCINLRPSRQPSVKFANLNCSTISYTIDKWLYIILSIILLREGYALLKYFSLYYEILLVERIMKYFCVAETIIIFM